MTGGILGLTPVQAVIVGGGAVASVAAVLILAAVFIGGRDGREERVWARTETALPGRAEWSRRVVGPARVMADPVRTWMIGLALAARPVAVRRDGPLNVSGPAEVPGSPGAAAVFPQDDCTAGPETPHPVTSAAGNHRPAAPDVTSLPPVDQAAHLQPIDWRDATGSFRAICEDVSS